MNPSLWTRLLETVVRETSVYNALQVVIELAAEMTGSRNVLLALLDEEQAVLNLTNYHGEDMKGNIEETMQVATGRGSGIVGYVAATGRTFESGDVERDPRYRKLFTSTRSEIAAPIMDSSERVLGVLNCESDRLNAYQDKHREIIRACAAVVAMVLNREESRQREEALIQIGNALDHALTEDALIHEVIVVAEDVLRFQAASLFLLDPENDTFVLRGSVGRLKSQIGEIRYRRGEGCTGWVCDTGQPLMLNDPLSDPRWRGLHIEFPSEQIASFLCVPIVSRGKSIGAIRVLRRVTDNQYLDNRFVDADLRLLTAVADQVSSGLENLRNVEKIIRSERMIAWGELSAKSSHMIGNRVFALKGDVNELGYLVRQNEVNPEELRSLQKSLEVNLSRIEEILQDFRDFVSATQLNRVAVDLNQLVQDTVNEVFPKRSSVTLDLSLVGEELWVQADARKLVRAISELVENSLSWSESGTLRIQTSTVDRSAYAVTRRSRARKFAQLEIHDSGPGVPEEEKQRIFEPFFSGRVKGMGLGLAIVKGIVDAHGGEVFEAGTPGEGANFVILLPLVDRP
jgi:signal transduction histidine kinase